MPVENSAAVITVGSSDVELSDSFRAFARDGISRAADKYLGRLTTASIHVNRDGGLFHCTVKARIGTLKPMVADSKHDDCYAAFTSALQKVEKQLRRTKRELREDKAKRVDKDAVLEDGLRPERREGGSEPAS